MKIIAAIIGMGIGQKHLDAIDNYKKSFVKIICEKNKKKLNKLKIKYPNKIITSDENCIYKDKEINLVSIASYDNYHYQQIINSIHSNKNIIVEKPMCLNTKQLKNIKKLLDKNKKIKMTSNLVLRVNSLFNKFKQKVNDKKIFYIEGDYLWGRKEKLFGWRANVKDYSLTLGAGIHLIDLIMWLTKTRPISVYSMGNKNATIGTRFKKESLIVMLFKFPKNIIVKITANGGAIYDHFHELKVFCLKQTYVNSKLGSFSYEDNRLIKESSSYPDKKNRKKLIRNFIDCLIEKKTSPIITIKEQIDLMSVCFAVDKSLKLNKTLKIKYF
tara:strand:- start:9341 stop:10324 length:984 start_codon:yes stop_codon:yes gene_type:complete